MAISGEMAVEIAQKEPQPQLVLMDVTMPGMNGYVACTEIKKASPELDVIFISANDTTEEVMQGFDVGGTDYIIKPIEQKILTTKIELALKNRMSHGEMHSKTVQATKTAMLAMTSSAEQAVIIDFLRDSSECDSNESIVNMLLDALNKYNLTACVQNITSLN